MTRNLSGRLTTGSIIVLIGLVLLASTTGLIAMRSVWGWIAAVFVLVGLWGLVRSGFRNLVGPVMIVAIAGTVLLRNLGLVPEGILGTWWPLYVVLFGVLVMVNRSRRRQRLRLEGTAASELTAVAIFGSENRRVTGEGFSGAEVLTVFGEAVFDLREATVRTRPAVLEAITVFGDAEIRVPEEWTVHVETLNVFGETTDTRRRGGEHPVGEEADLVVTGVTVFGDVEVRD